MKILKFVDLFAGIGGMRIALNNACLNYGIKSECVFTSEIKSYAIDAYKKNFGALTIAGDITKISEFDMPDFDFLLAGFPCQPFSFAGRRDGFMDIRGTLFFDIERILKAKKPSGFLLENVEGLINHNKTDKNAKYGKTLDTILSRLRGLGYLVNFKVLNSSDFGVPQNRARVYIIGSLEKNVPLDGLDKKYTTLKDILEVNRPLIKSGFVSKLLDRYDVQSLHGKSIKDKRGGKNNIHSWDIELKGPVSNEQKTILSKLLKQRRRKKWAEIKGIKWMDGMPLSLKEIATFHNSDNLEKDLEDLVSKGYLKYEYPKDVVYEKRSVASQKMPRRSFDKNKEKGYNIVTGKLSFEISKILDPYDVSPTLVATDVTKLVVPDGKGLRRLTVREGLRLFGFPEWYDLSNVSYTNSFDLLGNTVVVPVVDMLCRRYISQIL